MQQHEAELNGTTLCWFEWGAPDPLQETILLIHATGFHARCWDPVLQRLPGRHVIALDMRGHGRSRKDGPYNWSTFGQDVTEFVRKLDLTNLVGAGHSMGGSSITSAIAAEPGRFNRGVLVDPVIMDPALYHPDVEPMDVSEHPVARRKNLFDSPEAFYANLEGRGSYASWLPEALKAYCDHGVLPRPDGTYELACPPEVEASIYLGTDKLGIHSLLPGIAIPIDVLRAQRREGGRDVMDFNRSPTWPDLAQQFRNGTDHYYPELTHFIPMQNPDLVATFLQRACETP